MRRTLCYPAQARRARRRRSACVCGDGLESGEAEAFRGSIEAGGPLRRADAERGGKNDAPVGSYRRMHGHRKDQTRLDLTTRLVIRKRWITARRGIQARARIGGARLRGRFRSLSSGLPGAWSAAARAAMAFRAALAVVRYGLRALSPRHRFGEDLLCRAQRNEHHDRQVQAAALADLFSTNLRSQDGRPSRIAGSEARQLCISQ
jgi:hypothetical protein